MEPLKRIIFGLLILTGSSAFTEKCLASDTISAAEIEHFEQTWEGWTQDIVHEINPKLKLTVISRIEFSQNPEQIDSYEDMKMVQHLPGLPEVADPLYSRPIESPLYALVARKNIRIIFHNTIPESEKLLIEEVVKAKLKLTATDRFDIGVVEVNSGATPFTRQRAAIALLCLLLATGVLGITQFGHRIGRSPESKAVAVTKTELVANPTPELVIPAHYQIMESDPAVRRVALKREKIETIAKASLNCSNRFSNDLLGELEQHQFDLVNQWLIHNKKAITLPESNYARLLIAARIQEASNQKIISVISSLKSNSKNLKEASV